MRKKLGNLERPCFKLKRKVAQGEEENKETKKLEIKSWADHLPGRHQVQSLVPCPLVQAVPCICSLLVAIVKTLVNSDLKKDYSHIHLEVTLQNVLIDRNENVDCTIFFLQGNMLAYWTSLTRKLAFLDPGSIIPTFTNITKALFNSDPLESLF